MFHQTQISFMEKIFILEVRPEHLEDPSAQSEQINQLLQEGWRIQQMHHAPITESGRQGGQSTKGVLLTFWLKKDG